MKSKSFRTISSQFSIFTPALLFSKNKILEKIISKYADVFSGDTVSIPLPPDAPKDIPAIILHSTDNKFKMEIAESRLNIYCNEKGEDEINLKSFLEFCMKIIEDYIECTKPVIGRLALVTVKCVENDNPGLTLAKHFCQEKWIKAPFNRPENFELHSHKKYDLKEFHINSWVRCKTANLSIGNKPVVLVTQDINTLAEEMNSKDFKIAEIKTFAELTASEQCSILNMYFPE